MDNTISAPAPAPAAQSGDKDHKFRKVFLIILHTILMVLSALLIVFISLDTFRGIDFVTDSFYMKYQTWVCVVFVADYFIEMGFAENKWRYAWRRILFLLISIPYTSIISHLHIHMAVEHFYLLQFIPLLRAALAISIVLGYFSKNAVTSLFMSYIVIMLMIAYFGSLIFFQYEFRVNPQVTGYWVSLWWAMMNMSTVGCNIYPVTVVGQIVAMVLPIVGMVIFPLFTVYLTDFVRRHSRADIKQ